MSYGRWRNLAVGSVGALLAAGSCYYVDYDSFICGKNNAIRPVAKWDHNWDKMDDKSYKKSVNRSDDFEDEKKKNLKATRHIILVRHGQYNYAETDDERYLTKLGRLQAHATGKHLAELGLSNASIVRSTMKRAQETAELIKLYLPSAPVEDDSLLREGRPIQPWPLGSWAGALSFTELHYHVDGPRIEAAFRKYMHRPRSSDEQDSHTILVCHANVIRYFICRVMQFPPQRWIRMDLNHASITWISIYHNGRVDVRSMGDVGHMMPDWITDYS